MATAQITPREWDTQGNPVTAPATVAPVTEWDASGNPVSGATPSPTAGSPTAAPVPRLVPSHAPIDYDKLGSSLAISHVSGIPASVVYDNHDQVHGELAKRGIDLPKSTNTIAGDLVNGLKGSILAESFTNKLPEALHNPDKLDSFVEALGTLVGDLPVYLASAAAGSMVGGAAGSELPVVGNVAGAVGGGWMGAFAIPAILRETLTQGIKKGEITSFSDLMQRTYDTFYAAEKGALLGLVTGPSGKLVPSLTKALGPAAPTAEKLLKNQVQAAVLTTASALIEGHTPTASSFATNAALLGALGLVMPSESSAKDGLGDVYTKDGTLPKDTVEKLQAQPPVKESPKPGLQPAIKLTAKDGTKQVITGEDTTHADLAERVAGSRPIGIDELNADPKLASKVLSQPEIQVQQVIDRAYELKAASGDTSEVPPELKSGRGFAIVKGDTIVAYLNRKQALNWVKANEPDVYEIWKQDHPEDGAEFHSADYLAAHDRVNTRNLMEGEPGVPKELAQFYSGIRTELNDIKAGNESAKYGKSVLRTLLVGPRNMLRAQSEQLAGRLRKLVPDSVDQQAISFMRDYRDAPDELRAEIADIAKGDNEQLKAMIPAMEKALDPTPQMLEADKQLTDYFTQANHLRSTYVGTTSSIDPARYSPRNFMKLEDAEDTYGGPGTSLSKRSPHDIRREYLRLLDPLKSGDTVAKTFNAFDELSIYGDRLGKSVANSGFMRELKNSELGKHGIAGEVPPELKQMMGDAGILTNKELEELGGIPKNWVDLPGTAKTIVSNGRQVQVGFKVPPKIAKAVEPILQGDTLSNVEAWRIAKMSQAYIKAVELGLSPFHMRAMILSFVNNAGLDAYRMAMVTDNNSPEFEAMERDGALHGLETTKTQIPREAYRGLDMDAPKSRNTLLNKIKDGYEPIDKAFKGITKLTFEVTQRKFKVIDFATRKAAWMADHKQATDAEYGVAMRSIAKEVNAVYGGLNWDVMGVSRNYQAVARMILLAPDWTFSNLAGLKYAAFEWGTPGGNASRMFLLKSFITGAALTQGMSLFVSGQLSKQWDKVYLGDDKNGKEMYSSIFYAGLPKDTITLFNHNIREGFPTGIVSFGLNKAAPFAGTAFRTVLNKDWEGKDIRTKQDDTFLGKTGKDVEFIGGQLIPAPFVIKDVAKGLVDPDRDITYKDFLAGLVGASVYHETAHKESSAKPKGFHLKRGK